MEIKKVKGTIILNEIKFNRAIERGVIKNNTTSGKISVPPKLIGKRVYVVYEE